MWERYSKLLLCIALICLIQPSYAQRKKPVFKVQVNLVFLDVDVLDSQGKPVLNLNRGDFLVKENGVPVEITNFSQLKDVSLSLAVSLGTGFMPQSSLGIAKDAVSQLIHLLKPEDEICLLTFDQNDAYLEQGFTRERPQLSAALDNIGVTSESRRPRRLIRSFEIPPQVGLGIDLGLMEARKGVNKRKAVLLIRDDLEGLGKATIDHVREAGCTLIVLGFAEGSKSQLVLITDPAGSEQVLLGPKEVRRSGEDGSVTQLCQTIVDLLSSHYSIAYHTALPESSAARKIEVRVPQHDYRVLAVKTRD
jgi:VWFA-related protein